MTTTSTSLPSSADDPAGAPGPGLTGASGRASTLRRRQLAGGVVVLSTGTGEGDLAVPTRPFSTPRRHRAVLDADWSIPRQVHGANVLVIEQPTGPLAEEADALVSTSGEVALAVLGADCPLVALSSPEGVLAVAHAGWRGLLAGVLEATVATMRALGAGDIEAVLGPCIHVECYEFSPADLLLATDRLGPTVAGRSAGGSPALDLPEAVRVALAAAGVAAPAELGGCTACGGAWYSHRARRERARHALVCTRLREAG